MKGMHPLPRPRKDNLQVSPHKGRILNIIFVLISSNLLSTQSDRDDLKNMRFMLLLTVRGLTWVDSNDGYASHW